MMLLGQNFPLFFGTKFKIHPFLSGQNSPLFIGSKFEIRLFLLGQNSKFTPLYWDTLCKCSSQTFLSFRTLHLAYPKLIGTPCNNLLGPVKKRNSRQKRCNAESHSSRYQFRRNKISASRSDT